MKNSFKILPLATLMSAAWAVHAQEVAYAPEMLRALAGPNQSVDFSYFQKGYDIAPGTYRWVIEVNGQYVKSENVEIREIDGKLEPVFKVKDLRQFPFKEEVLESFAEMDADALVTPVYKYVEGVTTNLDAQQMKLEISVPQIHLADNQGWVDVVDPSLWDKGETGAVVNYNLTGTLSKSRQSPVESKNLYLNLSGRFNAGDWRLHTSGSFYTNEYKGPEFKQKEQEWDLWNTYVERDIPAWKGSLQIGELNTDGSIFETVPMRGVRVTTNEQMLPYRDRAYSPVIEGVANTNAQILIRQNGHIVHSLNVAPGPFKLDNLPNFGNYGDLEVIIKEADGSERIMNVPNTYVANMLREGQYRYDFNVGRYYRKNATGIKEPMLMMGTLAVGLPHDITVFGGTLLAEDYLSFALGTSLSLGSYGALTADVIQSHHRKDDERAIEAGSGAAWRVRYEKTLTQTGTTINLANYQYITGNFTSLQDYAEHGSFSNSSLWSSFGKEKSRWQLAMSQNLGSWGSFSLTGEYGQFHGNASDVKSISAGYYTSIKGVSVGLNYARNYRQVGSYGNKHWDSSHSVMLNLSFPLSVLFGYSTNPVVSSNSVSYLGRMERDMSGNNSYAQSVVMNGSSMNGWSWSVAQDLGSHEDRSTSVSATYSGARTITSIGADHNHYSNTYNIGLTGAIVAHRTGITLAPNAYDSVAIVEVPDAAGIKVSQGLDAETDMFGNAIVTYLSNYTRNEISIDPATLPDGALLLDSSNRVVVPTKGAIVRVSYPVRFGTQAVFVLQNRGGQPLPFGATVDLLDEEGNKDPTVTGMVGEGGRVYLTGLPKEGTLMVSVSDVNHTYPYVVSESDKPASDGFVAVPVMTLRSQY